MAEQPDIKVEDYYDKVHRKTWNRRTAGFLTGVSLFGAMGAIGGVVASFLPYTLNALGVSGAAAAGLPTLGFIGATTAVFTAATGFVGLVISADVGANSASIAAAMEEKERREKAQGLGSDLPAQTTPAKPVSLLNWKVSAFMAVAFAAFGALMAFSPATASVAVGALGLQGPALVAASSVVLGMFGASLGVNFPYITNKMNNFFSAMLKGEVFDKPKEVAVEPQPSIEKTEELLMADTPARNGKFACEKTRFSLQAIVDKTDDRSAETLITR